MTTHDRRDLAEMTADWNAMWAQEIADQRAADHHLIIDDRPSAAECEPGEGPTKPLGADPWLPWTCRACGDVDPGGKPQVCSACGVRNWGGA
jgi:hypothetical protein